VVIDHLTQITGDVDENTSEMATIMGNLRSMAESLNLAVILIHHQVKNASRFNISSSESLRGHGSILASCDLACVIERDKFVHDQVLIKPVAVRGANVDTIVATFSYQQKTDGSRELSTARFWGVSLEKQMAELDVRAREAVEAILEHAPGLNKSALKGALKKKLKDDIGDTRAREVIDSMVLDGIIYYEKGAKGSQNYFLVDGENGRSGKAEARE
jgi:hypothetical protein